MDRFTALEVFLETVKRGSISAAAEHLGLSRAMASRYLALLEEWTGARLLHRTTRKLSLTIAGEQALIVCGEIKQMAGNLAELGPDSIAKPKGKLRLASNSIFAEFCLTELLLNFLSLQPEIQVELNVVDRTVDLAEEGIDLAIRVSSALDPNLYARKLGYCSSVLCASAAYLKKNGCPDSLNDLKEHNCLTYTYFGQSVWRFSKNGEMINLPVSGNLSTNEAVVLLRATILGAGIAILPRFAVEREIKSGSLVPILTDYAVERLTVSAVYLTHKKMPLAQRVLIDYLVDNLQLP
ncbi:LysR family transcriptional regulator [Dickeya dadantii]|uniref:LysR family transcriptional regulator n=1 Tax=Dickeya dadantii TaxID=204038 RepID=UPI0013733E9C|nr:LysR family transcriptional regulator [Dickeya dadantii]NAT78333.1 LysR family transcriptional regulator [Dickeya dadantii]NPE61690.1 LysR family transcriptional regulator [Dickeya dadantii]